VSTPLGSSEIIHTHRPAVFSETVRSDHGNSHNFVFALNTENLSQSYHKVITRRYIPFSECIMLVSWKCKLAQPFTQPEKECPCAREIA
jgi:hypothetical protein